MITISSFKDLIVWKKSRLLVKEAYLLLKQFPITERDALKFQIQKSVISIPSNIAEGYGRQSTKDNIRFLNIAKGSLYEFQTQIDLAYDLMYISENNHIELQKKSEEINKMLCALIKKLSA